MDLARYDPASAQPFEGGSRALSSSAVETAGMTLRILQLEGRGETGRRQAPYPVALVVVAGEGQLRVGGEIAEVRAGDAVVVPPNTTYWAWTTGGPMTLALMECKAG
jgi:quercetin dioxygenase-like cupin family protein